MATAKLISVLYVDDEIHNLNSFKATFRKEFNVLVAGSAEEAGKIMEKNLVHVIITDQRMPVVTGVEFLIEIKEKYPNVLRVLLTGFTELTAIADALSKGQVHYRMEKPWDEGQIRAVIHAAYEIATLRESGGDAQDIDVAGELELILRHNFLS